MWGNHHISPRLLKSEFSAKCVCGEGILQSKEGSSLPEWYRHNKNLWMAVIQMRWDSSFFNHQGSRYESSPFRDVLKFPFLEVLESPADIQLKIHWFQQMLGDQSQNLPVQWPELCRMVGSEIPPVPKCSSSYSEHTELPSLSCQVQEIFFFLFWNPWLLLFV